METTDFDTIVGSELDFFGVDTNHFKLGDTIWNAVEDESDGYRSYLGSIAQVAQDNLIFLPTPLARVKVEKYEDTSEEGFRLIDVADAHVWLRVGTDNTDDYYPSFVFEYSPKAP